MRNGVELSWTKSLELEWSRVLQGEIIIYPDLEDNTHRSKKISSTSSKNL
jgi:hypothetical protein